MEAPKRRTKQSREPLLMEMDANTKWEIGVDEAGRGPLFGRLYVAGVILPKHTSFRHDLMKDSKRFTSQKKIREVAEYIKANAVCWTVKYADAALIDEINIRQAVLKLMRECCRELIDNIRRVHPDTDISKDIHLLIDGNDFPVFTTFCETTQTIIETPHTTVEGGDNTYTSIAAASILAKVSRDDYIETLCEEHPDLEEKYGILRNKGYGTKTHMDGIRQYGITEWHRKSYGPCKM